MKMKIVFSLLIIASINLNAQTYSNKVVGKKNSELIDSLKVVEYPYALPIWGEKVTQLGFDIPYSAGLSAQYLWQESEILINNLMVGFNNGQMFNLDEIVRFNDATAVTNGINVRPDIWLFPFLNIYGILAKSNNKTNVDFGIYTPGNFEIDIPNREIDWEMVKVMDLNTTAEFDATTFGFGLTPTMGVGGGWMAFDMNFTWTDIEELDKPASVFVFGPRFGKSFQFKKPEQNLAIWVGGFRVMMNTGTSGSLNLSELLPGMDDQIQNGFDKVEEGQQKVDEWWDSLPSGILGQENPKNIAKKAAAEGVLNLTSNVLDAASRAETVQYSLDKRQKNMWNFIVGSQFQINKSWMIRGEVGFLGSRTQVISGLQYRFGL